MAPLSAGLVLAAVATAMLAQAGEASVLSIEATVLDLVATVEHLDGDTVTYSVEEAPEEVTIQLAADVLFDFDSAELSSAAQEYLGEVAALIGDQAQGEVDIAGHTDGVGDDTYNQALSEERAAAVAAYLAGDGGLGGVAFAVTGHGETQPVAAEIDEDGADSPEGRQRNRRVAITYTRVDAP